MNIGTQIFSDNRIGNIGNKQIDKIKKEAQQVDCSCFSAIWHWISWRQIRPIRCNIILINQTMLKSQLKKFWQMSGISEVDSGSFTVAADLLRQTRAVVGFNIKQLEADLGVSLLTRQRAAWCWLRQGNASTISDKSCYKTQKLHKRMCAVAIKGWRHITDYDKVWIRHNASSRHANLMAEKCDITIRLGQIADSGYRAALIENFDIIPFVPPDYLQNCQFNEPVLLDDLRSLAWIAHSRLDTPLIWHVETPHNTTEVIDVHH